MSTVRRIHTDLGFIPCKDIDSMKKNIGLVVNDIVVISNNFSIYQIVAEVQPIRLNNELYAKLVFINFPGNVTIQGNEIVNGSVSCNSMILNGYKVTIE